MTKPIVTRVIESRPASGDTITLEIVDEGSEVTIAVATSYSSSQITMEKNDFLDLVVACWPENVAYQFSPTDT